MFSGILLALALAYSLLMGVYLYGFLRSGKKVPSPAKRTGTTSVAVIIPARNEAENIGLCLRSLAAQTYPAHLLQIVVVDDHSTDDTATLVQQMALPNLKVLRLADYPTVQHQAHKKYALATGISVCDNAGLILTTDADCQLPSRWVETLVGAYEETGAAALVAPVRLTPEPRMVVLFQVLDFAVMQGITAAVNELHIGTMANGANFGFSREVYDRIGGYEGTYHLASGDDFMLLHKIRQTGSGYITYVPDRNALVETQAQPDWRGFLRQRVRWASKSGKYPDPLLTAQLSLVYLFNLALVLAFPAVLMGFLSWKTLVGAWMLKVLSESLLTLPVLRYFSLHKYFFCFLLLQPLHNIYIVLAGFLGFFGSYEWKARQVR